MLSSNFSALTGNVNSENSDGIVGVDSHNEEIQFLTERITQEKVDEMKKALQKRTGSSEVPYPIIDGHGTGFGNPSEEHLDSLVGKVAYTGIVRDSSQNAPRFAAGPVDLSSEVYFPVVGDQGSQGSCSAWANVYYSYGYLEAKDNGWDTASSGNLSCLLSPAWVYNKLAEADGGSWPSDIAEFMMEWGVSTLASMPYDDSTVEPWGNEIAWREAPSHRPLDYNFIIYKGSSTIDLIKYLLDIGTPVTFLIDANEFSPGLNKNTKDYILSSAEYASSSLNHAQCIVGYNDAVSDDGDIGAFRVVNSWGTGFMDGGYYWLTYDALKEFAGVAYQEILFITDRADYSPNLIATWEFSTSPTRMTDILALGVGPHSAPLATITPHYNHYGHTREYIFPAFMALDISDFQPQYDADQGTLFYVEVGLSTETGIISSFNIERYTGGTLFEISREALNTPVATPGFAFTTLDITAPLWVETPSDQVIEYGTALSYDVNASDLAGISQYWNNDTARFAIDANGLIKSTVPLALGGEYGVEIRAYDARGNYCSTTIKIQVQAAAPPTWDPTPVDQVIEYGNALSYDVNASDLSGISKYLINDTASFTIDANGLINNTVPLAVGDYWVEIRAYDPLGNYCTAIIKITVEGSGIPGYDLAIVSVLIGVSVAGIVISKRKKNALMHT